MPPPDPARLFDQADGLLAAARQEDLRRAVSAAYYALFHFAVTEAANMIVPETVRSASQYSLVYRSVDHSWLRTLCQAVRNRPVKGKWRPYAPPGGSFGAIAVFAATVLELQQLRYRADYDPLFHIEAQNAKLKLEEARAAVELFQTSDDTQQKAFLFLLLFRPRGEEL